MQAVVALDRREGMIVGLEVLDTSALLPADLRPETERPAER
jgi:hypothetical protein